MKLNIKTLIDDKQVFNETYLANLKEEKDYFFINYKDNYQEKITLIIYKNLEKVVIDKSANQLIVEKEEKITSHKIREGIVKLKTRLKCAKIIKRGFSSSTLLMSAAWIFQGILGFVLGIISGVKRNTLIDKIIKAYAIILSATPTYWVGIVLITIFSLKLGIFPASMAAPIGIESYKVTIFDRLYHLILPAITLALVGTANIILHTREKVIEILNSDYCLYAKSKGLSDFKIIKNFALKNIMLPAITLQFSYFSELFSGTILAENVFNYPGLGNLTVQAGLRGDLPLLLGLVLFSAIFVFLGNRMADLFYIIIDPQMREKA